jgi:hypothetical protein
MSVTQQKADLREIIHREVERRIAENPERAPEIAMGAVRRLSGKMTLKELEQWHFSLFGRRIVEGIKNAAEVRTSSE